MNLSNIWCIFTKHPAILSCAERRGLFNLLFDMQWNHSDASDRMPISGDNTVTLVHSINGPCSSKYTSLADVLSMSIDYENYSN